MKEEGKTAYKVSKETGITKSMLYYWMQGVTTPNADYIIALADYFEVCADYLLGRQDWY